MTNKVYLVHNSGYTYDVMYSSSNIVKGFQFDISNKDNVTLSQIINPTNSQCALHDFFLNKSVIDATNNNTRVLAVTFGTTAIPATTTTDLLLCQFKFSGQLNNKPTIINIDFTCKDATGVVFNDTSYEHGGSILTLPNAIQTTTYERHNTITLDLYTTLDAAKQWADDHTLNISNNVDFSTEGTYSVTYSMYDVFDVETTETVYITIEDTIAPTLSNVTLLSSQSGNSGWARQGDTVTLSFKSDEKLQTVDVTMKSGTTDVDSNRITSSTVVNNTDVNGNLDGTETYSYSYVTESGDDNGAITFTINYEDLANNNGATVITAENPCYYDNIIPIIPVLVCTIDTSNNDYDVTFTFEQEPVMGFTKEDVTVASDTDGNPLGTLGGVDNKDDDLTSSTDGMVWTGKFYPKPGHIVTGGELSLDCSNSAKCIFTDLAGNPVSSEAESKSQYPTVSQFVLQKNSGDINKLLENETGTVKLVFSEPVTGFNSCHDITVSHGTLTGPDGIAGSIMTSSDNTYWTGTFTPDDDLDLGTNAVDILTLHNTYKDSHGNTGVTAKLAFILDTLPPTVKSISFSNHPMDGSDHPFGVGENILIDVEFSQVVVLSTITATACTLSLNSGIGRTANYYGGDNSSTIQFLYNVDSQDDAYPLEVTDFNLDSGVTLKDLNGNTANTSIIDVSQMSGYAVDGVRPTVIISAKNNQGHDVTSGSTTNDKEIVLEFTLSEATTNFVVGGITVSGGTLNHSNGASTFAAISSTVYTATFTPDDDGAYTICVDKNSFTDEAGNGNNAATQFVWTYDRFNPSVSITAKNDKDHVVTSGDTTNDAKIVLEFELNQDNTNFEEADITVNNGVLSDFTQDSTNTTLYTAIFTPTLTDSDVDANPDSNEVVCSIYVHADEFTDAEGNNNTEASFTWTCDRRLPVVNSVSPITDGYYNDEIYFDIEFDEQVTVSGSPTLTLTDNLIATAVSNTTLSDTVRFEYHVTNDDDHHYIDVSIPENSTIDLNGGLNDLINDAHNNNAVLHVPEITTNIVIDNRQPVVSSVALGASSTTTNNANVEVTFTSDKSSHYYDTNSCVVVNDSSSSASYTVNDNTLSVSSVINPDTESLDWTITIDTGVSDNSTETFSNLKFQLTDKAGNNSHIENIPAFTVDRVKPTVVIKANVPIHTNNPTIRIESSKAGTAELINNTSSLKFENNEIKDGEVNELRLVESNGNSLSNGTYDDLKFEVIDELGNASNPITIDNFILDTTHGNLHVELSIRNSEGHILNKNHAKKGDVIRLDISRHEDLSLTVDEKDKFVLDYVKFIINDDDDKVYIAQLAQLHDSDYKATHHATYVIDDNTENGLVSVEYKTTDNQGNTETNDVLSGGQVTVDTTHPTLAITSEDIDSGSSSNHANIELTFTFDEAVHNFHESDITILFNSDDSIDGSSKASLSDFKEIDSTEYTVILEPLDDGEFAVSVPGDCCQDAAENLNEPSNTFIWNYDSTRPTIYIEQNPEHSHYNHEKVITFTLSKISTDFVKDDITVTKGVLSNFTQDINNTTLYTATFTPSHEGTCEVYVVANKFTDHDSNQNTASNQIEWEHSTSLPTLTEETPIAVSTNNNEPEYTFSSNKTDFLTLVCTDTNGKEYPITHTNTSNMTDGSFHHTITFHTLEDGLYELTLDATDKHRNVGETLVMRHFRVDTSVSSITTSIKSLNASPYLAKPGDEIRLTINTTEQVQLPEVTFKVDNTTIVAVHATDISGGYKDLFLASYRIKSTTPSGLIGVSISITDLVEDEANNREFDTITTGSVVVYSEIPELRMLTPIPLHTSNSRPSFIFTASVADCLICYNGGQYGDLDHTVEGVNTITLYHLDDGEYSNLSIDVSDIAGNKSEILEIPHFTVDTSSSIITQYITTDNMHNEVSIAKQESTLTLHVESTDDDIDFVTNYPEVKFSVGTTILTETVNYNTTTNKSYTATITLPDGLSGRAEAESITHNLDGLKDTDNNLVSTVTVDTVTIELNNIVIDSHHNNSKPDFTIESNKDNLSLHCNDSFLNSIPISHSVSYNATKNKYIYTIQFDHLENNTHGNLKLHATDAAGNTSEIQIPEFIIDMEVAKIISITTELLAGSYTIGEIVSIEVTFDEDVKIDVTNPPKLLLDSDDDSEDEVNAIYNSGNETDKLIFNYTIKEGENYNQLNVLSISGIITDLAGNHADLSDLPSDNELSHIEIDTTAPVLTEEGSISTPGNDNTPTVTFSTDKPGTLTTNMSNGFKNDEYNSIHDVIHITNTGEHTVRFAELDDGEYDNVKLILTDEAGNDGVLEISDFEIDTVEPILTPGPIPSHTNNPTFTLSSTKTGTITYSDGVKGVASLDYSYFNNAAIMGSAVAWNLDGITNTSIYKNDYPQLTNNEFIDKALNYMNLNTNIVAFVVVYTDNTKSVINHIVAKGGLDEAYNKPHTTTGETVYVLSQNVSQAQTKIGTQPISESFIGGVNNITAHVTETITLVKSDGNPLDHGEHDITVKVTDEVGNQAEKTYEFNMDTLPPEIKYAKLERVDGKNVAKDGDVVVFLFETEEELDASDIQFLKLDQVGGHEVIHVTSAVEVDDTSDKKEYKAEYTVDINDEYNGPLSVKYTLRYKFGNVHYPYEVLEKTVTIDNTELKLIELNHIHTYTNKPEFTIETNKVVTLEVEHESTIIFTESNMSNIHTIVLSNHLSQVKYDNLKVKVIDHVGNVLTETLNSFTFDETHPVIEHVSFTTSPPDKTHIKDGDSITAKIEYDDNLSGLDQEKCKLTFKLEGHTHSHVVSGDNLTFYHENGDKYFEGTWHIDTDEHYDNAKIELEIEIEDAAENEYSDVNVQSNIILDTVHPTLSHVPGGNVPEFTNHPTFTFHSSEEGHIHCDEFNQELLYEPENPVRDEDGNYTITFKDLEDRKYSNVSLKVTDEAGNTSHALHVPHFTVDTLDSTLFQTTVKSNNNNGKSPYLAKPGDEITITIQSNERLNNPQLEIKSGGHNITNNILDIPSPESDDLIIYTYVYMYDVSSHDSSGEIGIQITATSSHDNHNISSATIFANTVHVYTTMPNIVMHKYDNSDHVDATLELFYDNYVEYGAMETTSGLSIVTTVHVDTHKIGDYIVEYTATDPAGNSSTKQRIIKVRDTLPPTLTLENGGNIIIEEGGTFNLNNYGAHATEVTGATIPNSVQVTGSVNTNEAGVYTITYSATDNSGNTGTIHRTVTVAGTGIPTISLIGEEFESYNIGDVYHEQGATCINADHNHINIDASELKMHVKGFYKIKYTLDGAEEVIRYIAVGHHHESSEPVEHVLVGDMDDDGELGIMDIWLLTKKVLEQYE